MTYQIFSSASGAWGPVKRSARLEKGRAPAYWDGKPKDVVVCRGAVYWLGVSFNYGRRGGRSRRAFAIDVRTEWTWTTELPEKYVVLDRDNLDCSLALATAG
ncbi:hypothetical protein BAE44_0002400 [Dichanthelium oligosanthes]|uniref:Uncharacterized protein n=1 Tax=Dichanthelium oligosanthes TaxID=888268 RepID=A0A1E5WGS6_9POAL|nr:hypothetical protein BAE44_0002400 [Dichanthelium oligosanthes]